MKRRAPVVVRVARAEPLAFLGAAYLLTDRAFVSVDRRGAVWEARLRPKAASGAGLKEAFRAAYDGQKVRWAVERANLPVRAEVLRRALALDEAAGVPRGPGTAAALSPEDRARMDAALSEGPVEDPRGIKRYWEDRRRA